MPNDMVTPEQIINLIKEDTGANHVTLDTDIFSDLGIVGDDFHELIEKYSILFQVNMKNYLWYFHADEEGNNFGGLFFTPPNKRVNRIPVTPKMLVDFANSRRWQIDYPEHKLAKYRIDLLINQLLFAGVLIAALLSIWTKCLN